MTTTDLRPNLRAAYLMAFDNFATTRKEVAAKLAIEPAEVTPLFNLLGSKGLTVSENVNGSEWVEQCLETYDSISRSTAIRRFDAAFPKGEVVTIAEPKPSGRKGQTGPRYTENQIVRAIDLRKAGKSWNEVAEIVGVKSPSYFSRVIRSRAPGIR